MKYRLLVYTRGSETCTCSEMVLPLNIGECGNAMKGK